ncbi:Polyphosphoinositide phosphatase [Spathaspora sp. JA1]|nr:Polyphosphoinositide phosphatase [Spathaspora sp. JA1]
MVKSDIPDVERGNSYSPSILESPPTNEIIEGELEEEEQEEQDEEEEQDEQDQANNKRIILQRFTVYNSQPTMYIVGSNAKESLFRIMEIGTEEESGELVIIEDKNYFYTRKDMVELLNGLNESIPGGIHKIVHGFGLLGLIRFTKCYYLSIITKCSQVAILGGHFIYHIDETKLIPIEINYKKPEKYSDEERLLSIFKYLDLSKTFYFSYSYDITNSLQTNFMRNKQQEQQQQVNISHNERFVWNNLLLKPVIENNHEITTTYEWFQPIIHGFIDQANISIYGRKIYITIIARRSHHFAGARFLKRGVNDTGNVANEIETEQIISDMLTSSFHDCKYGYYNNPRYTSFVQHRGSIPLYWTQDLNKLPKPPIEINLIDPFYQSSAKHFNDLFARYGSPIIILNLIKQKERQPRESKLNSQFINCIKYLNQFLPSSKQLQYYSFDMSRHSKKNLDVITPLQKIANTSIKQIGFFHNGTDLATTKLQIGIIRTNCIDCLDRTNAAQFIICKEALVYQLQALKIIPLYKSLDYDSDLINILTEIFHDHGDTIAIQYGGSNLVNTMDSYRRINQWSSHTRDVLNSIKRMYSNSFMDQIRQDAINLFLGNYVYSPNKPKLWELSNDFSLHNERDVDNFRVKPSYIHWYNENYLSNSRFDLSSKSDNTQQHLDYNDKWFNECYLPRKFQSLNRMFQFNMNSNSRYFPSNQNLVFDYSPFESRKQQQQQHLQQLQDEIELKEMPVKYHPKKIKKFISNKLGYKDEQQEPDVETETRLSATISQDSQISTVTTPPSLNSEDIKLYKSQWDYSFTNNQQQYDSDITTKPEDLELYNHTITETFNVQDLKLYSEYTNTTIGQDENDLNTVNNYFF